MSSNGEKERRVAVPLGVAMMLSFAETMSPGLLDSMVPKQRPIDPNPNAELFKQRAEEKRARKRDAQLRRSR